MQPSRFTIEHDLSIAENFQFAGITPSIGQYTMQFIPTNEEARNLFFDINVTIGYPSNRLESVVAEDPEGNYYNVQLSPTDTEFILRYVMGA
jgi:hypothetical protein